MPRHLMHWLYVHQAVARLEKGLKKIGKFQHIVGIARGGMIPAVMLSHALDVRTVSSLQIQSYNDLGHRGTLTCSPTALLGIPNSPSTLIVDDIIDTGATFDYLVQHLPRATFCALASKLPTHHALHAVDFPKDTWVVFPWEAPYSEEMRKLTDHEA